MAGRKHSVFFVITAVLLCFALFGSFLFVAVNAAHDCTHNDDCSVCRMIDACIHSARFMIAAAAALICALAVIMTAAAVSRSETALRPTTLISLRTELRN